MILVLDIGNSNIKIGLYRGDDLVERWKIPTDTENSAGFYGDYFRDILKNRRPKGLAVSSVVPAMTPIILEAASLISKDVLFLGDPAVDFGLDISPKLRRNLGHDIVCDMVAARRRYGNNFIVIDMGTATTVSYTDANGMFQGGAIAIGMDTMAKCLSKSAAQLMDFEVREQESVVDVDTISAMNGGVYWGYIGLLRELVFRIKQQYEAPDAKVCITGNRVPILLKNLDFVDDFEANLTLDGLNIIYHNNRRKA